MPQGAQKPVLGFLGDYLYVLFKPDDISGKCIMLCYNTVACTWSPKVDLPSYITEVAGTQAVTVRGCLFLMGGRDNICARFDPQTREWVPLMPCNFDHNKGAAWVFQNKIYLSGGDWPSNVIEMYDPNTGNWHTKRFCLPEVMYDHCVILS